jgi:hypothetical protein
MSTRRELNVGLVSVAAAATVEFVTGKSFAQATPPIDLPEPAIAGGKSLMQSLRDRQSIREYSDRMREECNSRRNRRCGQPEHLSLLRISRVGDSFAWERAGRDIGADAQASTRTDHPVRPDSRLPEGLTAR